MEDTKTTMPRNRLDPAAIDTNSVTDSTFPSSKAEQFRQIGEDPIITEAN